MQGRITQNEECIQTVNITYIAKTLLSAFMRHQESRTVMMVTSLMVIAKIIIKIFTGGKKLSNSCAEMAYVHPPLFCVGYLK